MYWDFHSKLLPSQSAMFTLRIGGENRPVPKVSVWDELSPHFFFNGTIHIKLVTAHRNMDSEDRVSYLVIQQVMSIFRRILISKKSG